MWHESNYWTSKSIMGTPIPDSLESRIEAIYEQAGYATKSEFVRDAVRHWLDVTEEEEVGATMLDKRYFRYDVHAYSDRYKISLVPTRDSPLNLSYSRSNLSFTFDGELLDRDPIESRLDDVPGVKRAGFQTEPAIVINIAKDIGRSISAADCPPWVCSTISCTRSNGVVSSFQSALTCSLMSSHVSVILGATHSMNR